MSNRDDFSKKIRNAVAARAGWRCSFKGCQKLTVGPSEESSVAITNIGVAAHISAAAAGPGSRRYNPSLSQEERSGIDNAIWLCADHAVLIDRDEVSYPVEILRAMKSEHETACAEEIRAGTNPDMGAGLIAVGPDIVCAGDIAEVTSENWVLRLRHFIVGDLYSLIAYIDKFAEVNDRDRYVLVNEFGDGRVLAAAPKLSKENGAYRIFCPVAPGFRRIDAQEIGSAMALHPETNDLFVDSKGSIARVSGIEYLPQHIQSALSMQRGENVFAPAAGMRFFEYCEAFKDTPWLAALMKLDVVRQAAIPVQNDAKNPANTPIRCVLQVHNLEILSEAPNDNRLPIRLDLEVQGVGRWQRHLSVYIPTREQMAARAEMIRIRAREA